MGHLDGHIFKIVIKYPKNDEPDESWLYQHFVGPRGGERWIKLFPLPYCDYEAYLTAGVYKYVWRKNGRFRSRLFQVAEDGTVIRLYWSRFRRYIPRKKD